MVLGIIGLAMLAGGGAALISGQPVLAALVIYSGVGSVCALCIAAMIRPREPAAPA